MIREEIAELEINVQGEFASVEDMEGWGWSACSASETLTVGENIKSVQQ